MDKEYPDWQEKAKRRRKKKKQILSLGGSPAKRPADVIKEEVEVTLPSLMCCRISGAGDPACGWMS